MRIENVFLRIRTISLQRFSRFWIGCLIVIQSFISHTTHAGDPLHVVFMIGEQEYETARTLPRFVQQELVPRGVVCTFAHVSEHDSNHFGGLDDLKHADVLLISVRRRTPPADQMDAIRQFIQRGGAVVGIRTASHAFDREPPDAGHRRWETFDRDILGGHYLGHYSNKPPLDPPSEIRLVEDKKAHPILRGIERASFISTSHLYKNQSMSPRASILLNGFIGGRDVKEPVAWTHASSWGGRVFYTSLGNPRDFEIQPFRRLLLNAIYWAAERNAPDTLLHEGMTQDYDSSASQNGWVPMPMPGDWESHPTGAFENHDGFAWYRAYVHVPEDWKGSRLLLVADHVDDVDEGFFNGIKIGANGSMPPLYGDPSSSIRRPFVIDPDWIRFGEDNLIAWRVYDKGGQGGILKGPIHLSRRDDAIDLQGVWMFRTGDAPSWAQWDHTPGSQAATKDIETFRTLAGPSFGGYRGVVPADIGGRQRRIQEVYERYKGNTNPYALTADKGDPLSPEEARSALKLSDGLAIDAVLSEPEVRQPLFVDFDERGRMWVVQYIQYPNPAGLEVLTWDNHLRKVFDAVPPPPPFTKPEHQKFVGKDKITIHEDVDGDGEFETHKTFLDGLNMCTSLAFDKDGVWVMHPPYLLFYPDRNHDDEPDGPPEVHLSGFGLEDTHSISNSLKWGPDGWLYGATGSTVTARVKAELSGSKEVHTFFGQNIWRYHPDDRRFELFAEGGWNTFGVDFDSKGRVYSGTNGNLQSVYFVQGGYYQKSFGKHGPHTNPYTYGHFFGLPIDGENVRLVHQWVLYESEAIPSLQGHFVGGNSLGNKVHALQIATDGSTFKTVEIEKPVRTEDKWFRPVHTAIGPDGAIYLSDWYDARITHVDPRDNWDRERGRIYRLRDAEHQPGYRWDLKAADSVELVALQSHSNQWVRATSRRLLKQRQEESVIPLLRERLNNASSQAALEALWTLEQLGARDGLTTINALRHSDPYVRIWGARLAADQRETLSSPVFESMLDLARTDDHPEVISQLAASAQRLPETQGYPLVQALYQRNEWTADAYIPQQVWWGLEAQIQQRPEGVLDLLNRAEDWQFALLRTTLLERIGRRLTSEQNPESLNICARLLQRSPDRDAVSALLRGMELALQGSRLEVLPLSLETALKQVNGRFGSDPDWVGFGLRIGSQTAFETARGLVKSSQTDAQVRTSMIARLSELHDVDSVPLLLDLVKDEQMEAPIRLSALNGLRRFDQEHIADVLLQALPNMNGDLRQTAQSVLSGRTDWARRMLTSVREGKLKKEHFPFDVLVVLQQRKDPELSEGIRSIWGNLRQPEADKTKRISEVSQLLDGHQGNAEAGKELFQQVCGLCHVLHGEGRQIGPELTGYERSNLEFLLPAIIDPSLAVREEYELVTVTLRPKAGESEGALLTGFITAMEGGSVSIKDLAGNLTVLAETDIAERVHSPVSIMPEGLLDTLSAQQIADLFAYIQK